MSQKELLLKITKMWVTWYCVFGCSRTFWCCCWL